MLFASALGLALAIAVKWNEAGALHQEIALLQSSASDLAVARSENARLARSLPDANALAALRADHAAVSRLTAEIEQLKANVRAREAALAAHGRN